MPQLPTGFVALGAIEHRDAYTRAVERELIAALRDIVFAPISAVLAEHRVQLDPRFSAIRFDEFGRENAISSALERALAEGRIHYADGVFSGKFSSAISRELQDLGASYNARAKTFTIPESAIPLELRGVLATAAQRAAAVTTALDGVLTAIAANVGTTAIGLSLERQLGAIVEDLGRQFVSTTMKVEVDKIGITPQIDVGMREILDREFVENLELGITDFVKERIPELRRRVEENALKFGGRTDRLAKIIEAEFGVTARKAEFLADQETGLLVSKYREARYRSIGVEEYIWSTSGDGRVRQTHRELNGKRFRFSNPPNVAPAGKPARFCNPGQDYRCRCVPRPLINLAELSAA